MKKSTTTPTTAVSTATRRATTYHRDSTGACIATTVSQTNVDVALHTTGLPATEAQILTMRMAAQAIDLLS